MLSWKRTAGAFGAAALLVAAGAALPAQAAGGVALEVDAPATYYLYAPGTGPGFDDLFDDIDLHAKPLDGQQEPMVHGVKVTIDLSALAGKVVLRDAGSCDISKLVVTCDVGTVEGSWTLQPFYIKSADAAKPGESAAVKIHATAADAPTVDRTMKFVIGNPKLSANKLPDVDGIKPGASFDLPVAIKNQGNVPADAGFGVLLDGSDGMEIARKHSNCHYEPASWGRAMGWCRFGTVLKPGDAVRFTDPATFDTDTSLMYGDVNYWAWPLDGQPPYGFSESDYSLQGDGPPLGLESAGDATFTSSTFGSVTVAADNHADFEAYGDTVEGKVGETVTVTVGTRNLGPGTMDMSGREGTIYNLKFTPPAGTTVVSNPFPGEDDPWTCSPRKQGAAAYTCPPYSETIDTSKNEEFVFRIRIDKKVAGAEGKVEVFPNQQPYPSRDGNPANNVASVPVKVTGGTTGTTTGGGTSSPSPTPSTSASSSPSTGSTSSAGGTTSTTGGGGLASTGAGNIRLAMYAAAAALTLGTGTVLAMRQRRGRRA
jgi:hypothetical protein